MIISAHSSTEETNVDTNASMCTRARAHTHTHAALMFMGNM